MGSLTCAQWREAAVSSLWRENVLGKSMARSENVPFFGGRHVSRNVTKVNVAWLRLVT